MGAGVLLSPCSDACMGGRIWHVCSFARMRLCGHLYRVQHSASRARCLPLVFLELGFESLADPNLHVHVRIDRGLPDLFPEGGREGDAGLNLGFHAAEYYSG